MKPRGPKLAEGRDAEIFEHGPGQVLRLARDGRSLVGEADVMTHVREHGYPAPEVYDAGDGYLVMQRVDGPSMLDVLLTRPTRVRECGALLAELHRQLHVIPGLMQLPAVEPAGDRLLHRDLHPLNVLMAKAGPVVIDWSNCARGAPAYDVADTWVLFAVADVPGSRKDRAVAALARRLFLRSFLRGQDVQAARAAIPAVVRHRIDDRNMSEAEKARMRRMAALE